jgi:hypothetical protein
MRICVPISVGDFIDRYSILVIKRSHNLSVTEEIESYELLAQEFAPQSFSMYFNMALAINKQLWTLEDIKRSNGLEVGSTEYIEVAELITHLNDLRYQIKKSADKHFGSSIQEKKSHEQ